MSQDYTEPEECLPAQAAAPALAIAAGRIIRSLQVAAIALSVALGTPVLAIDGGAPPQILQEDTLLDAADDAGDDEGDNADYPDDGSSALKIRPGSAAPAVLLPLSPSEEKGLLGNWGDSATEAED